MAGTVTLTKETAPDNVTRYALDWTANSSGAVNSNPFGIEGRVIQVRIVPDSGGTQPTDLYDLTLVDEYGVDLLDSQGSNLSQSTGLYVMVDPPIYIGAGRLDLVITNAGDSKGGLVHVWTQP